jgi:hypothetical protein
MDVFRHLLTHTKSEYANLWGHLMAEQFSPVATSEAQWSDFVRFAAEFREAGAREECVEQIDTRPMLRVVNNKE